MEPKDFLKQEHSKKLASFMATLLLVMVAVVALFVGNAEPSTPEFVLTDSDGKVVDPGENAGYLFEPRSRADDNVSLETSVTYLIPKLEYTTERGPEPYKEYPDGLKLVNGMSFKTDSTGMWSLAFEEIAAMTLHKNTEITIEEMTYPPLPLRQKVLKFKLHNDFLYNRKVTFQAELPTADSFLDVFFALVDQKEYSVRVDHTEETIFSLALSGNNYDIKVFKGSVKLLDYNSGSKAIGEKINVTVVDEGKTYNETGASSSHDYNLIKITSPADVVLRKGDFLVGAGNGGNFTHGIPNVAYLDTDEGEGATSDSKYFIIEDLDGTGLLGVYRFELSRAPPVETAMVEILRYDASKYGGETVVATTKLTPDASASFSVSVNNWLDQIKIDSSIPSEYTITIDVGSGTVFEASNVRISNDKNEKQMHSFTLAPENINNTKPVDFGADIDDDGSFDAEFSLGEEVNGADIEEQILEETKPAKSGEEETNWFFWSILTVVVIVIAIVGVFGSKAKGQKKKGKKGETSFRELARQAQTAKKEELSFRERARQAKMMEQRRMEAAAAAMGAPETPAEREEPPEEDDFFKQEMRKLDEEMAAAQFKVPEKEEELKPLEEEDEVELPEDEEFKPQEEEFKLPEGEFKLPVGEFKLPAEEFKPSVEEFKPSVEEEMMPAEAAEEELPPREEEEFKPPVEEFPPEEEEFKPQEEEMVPAEAAEEELPPEWEEETPPKEEFKPQEEEMVPAEAAGEDITPPEEEMDFELPDVMEEEELSLEEKFGTLFKDMGKIEALKNELVDIETTIKESAFTDTEWWDNWDHQMKRLLHIEDGEE